LAGRLKSHCNVIAGFFNISARDVSPQAHLYVAGLLTRCPRKNVERICEEMPGAKFENVQYFLSESPWKCAPLWKWVASRASKSMDGGADSMLLIDESCFTKKGVKSAGVARQYNGRLGKVDNCQVGVFSALSHGERSVLTGARLYLPEEWVKNPDRCQEAGIPLEERKFRTKPQLAWELIEQADADGIPFDWVGMDAVYGRDQSLLLRIAGMGKKFVADVNHDQLVWISEPQSQERPVKVSADGAVRVDTLWKAGNSDARKVKLRDGENGRVRIRFWAQRVWIWPSTSEIPIAVWLAVTERADGTVKYSLTNAAETTEWTELARRQGQRYFVERAFEDGKSELGMGEYQARRWLAWHHHMVLVAVAMVFALEERELLKADAPMLSVRDIVDLIAWYFEKGRTDKDVETAIRIRHRRREKAMKSKMRRKSGTF
jgi:SRSO17 transposase